MNFKAFETHARGWLTWESLSVCVCVAHGSSELCQSEQMALYCYIFGVCVFVLFTYTEVW